MAAGDAHVAGLLDTVHHEMDNVVCGHYVYKLVWLLIIGEQLILEKELANSHNEFAVTVIKDSQMVGHILKNYSQITYYFITLRGSITCYITGKWRNGKA